MSKEKEESLLWAIILWPILSIFVIVFGLGIFVSLTKKNEKQEVNTANVTSELGLEYKVITLQDGRKIECVNYRGNDDGSIYCNLNNPANQKIIQHK